jgi:hypothetical protein
MVAHLRAGPAPFDGWSELVSLRDLFRPSGQIDSARVTALSNKT